jgi:hypothetical protein
MMASTEERMKILRMIDEGKLTAEEGAKLLAALSDTSKAAKRPVMRGPGGVTRMLRVRVTDTRTGKAKATVNLPLAMVDFGLKIASQYVPDISFDEIAEMIHSGTVEGKIVDVIDEEDGEHVEIFIE